jgi:hypothetical protein
LEELLRLRARACCFEEKNTIDQDRQGGSIVQYHDRELHTCIPGDRAMPGLLTIDLLQFISCDPI